MDFFDEIAKAKKELPKVNTITNEVTKYKLNFYQIFAIGLFVIFFFLGIVLGNLFATCEATTYFYADACVVKSFNFSLMLIVWFVSMLVSIFIFSIGHIISILLSINEKLSKFNS